MKGSGCDAWKGQERMTWLNALIDISAPSPGFAPNVGSIDHQRVCRGFGGFRGFRGFR